MCRNIDIHVYKVPVELTFDDYVFAGIFSPILNVSVAIRHLISPSWKRISITSFKMGKRPPICVCVREKGSAKERERESVCNGGRERERMRERVCVSCQDI